MSEQEQTAWMKEQKKQGLNSEWIFIQLQAIEEELRSRDKPSRVYINEKLDKFKRILDDIDCLEDRC